MTPEQKAAFVMAQTQMMIAEREVMIAENIERERQNYALANGPKQWENFRLKWELVLGHNTLISFFHSD